MGLFSSLRRFFTGNTSYPPKVDYCFFGLGNPGEQYRLNRHNIGFRVIDFLNSSLTEIQQSSTSNAEITVGKLGGHSVIATVKPLTFMNNSGIAVSEVLNQFKATVQKHIVIVDDFNIPIGTIRFRKNGSHGGHNGLKSIISAIGSDFPRLRIGIGPLPKNSSVIDFVLGNFNEHEESELNNIFPLTQEALQLFTAEPIETVMNKYN